MPRNLKNLQTFSPPLLKINFNDEYLLFKYYCFLFTFTPHQQQQHEAAIKSCLNKAN